MAAAMLVAAATAVFLALPPARLALPPSTLDPAPTVVAGVSHVHTSRSDGTGSPDDVAAAAARAGLQFVLLTDHGDGTREPDPPQYRSGVLCLDGVEISTTAGHYLALGLPRAPYRLGGEPRDVVEDVRRLGGFGVVAHPDSTKPELRWDAWDVPFDAIEWLNGDTEWRDETPGRLARALVSYPFRPVETAAALFSRPNATLRRWDGLASQRPVVGLAGSDAHARLGLGGEDDAPYRSRILMRLPSYDTLFSVFSIRVELDRPFAGDAGADAARLLAALRAGRVYSVMDGLAAPPQFELTARSGAHSARQGDAMAVDGPVVVEIRTNAPPAATITLFRNGEPYASGPGPVLRRELPPDRAVVRAEVRLDRTTMPWIVSNPLYVAPVAPVPPAPAPPAADTTRLDAAGAEAGWHVERAADSSATLERAGEGPATIRYELGAATAPYAALVVPAGAALGNHTRVAFEGRADAPMRLSVQLRRPDDDGQRWRRSVYLDATPRDVSVAFADMTPAGPTDTPAPDPAAAREILFVVDTVHTQPGTSGAFTIDRLRLER